jgi:alkaline phosphatase
MKQMMMKTMFLGMKFLKVASVVLLLTFTATHFSWAQENHNDDDILDLLPGVLAASKLNTDYDGDGGCSDKSGNAIPIADAGYEQFVTLQSGSIPIDGRASRDDDGDVLSFQWELTSKPLGSAALLSSITTVTPLLSVDLEGTYIVSLIVNDGVDESEPDSTVVTVVPYARNIILLIGDGMGFEQVRAASMYENGAEGGLSFETLPFQGRVSTFSASSAVTDSAAAATALATGSKVNNGVISLAIPGDSTPLMTILERIAGQGAATGLVTTTTITHATPAAFAAHESSRNNQPEIGNDYLNDSRPDVLMGGAQFVDAVSALEAGYAVVTNRESLTSLDTEIQDKVWGQFGKYYLPYEEDGLGVLPHLSEMVQTALQILDNDPDGFFLMIEGGRIDHAGHINDLNKSILETIEFSHSAQKVLDWASGRTDTLVVVTADHETGGLVVSANNGVGSLPNASWQTTGHTEVDVPVYAWGVNAHMLNAEVDNTFIHNVMLSTELD